MPTSAPETDLVQYYALRAHEYEAVYAKPERQVDIAQIQAWLPGAFEGRDGVEVACGTGFWWSHVPLRRLADGSQHEVLKNFPTQAEAVAALGSQASAVQWTETTYYWLLCYTWAPEARA